MASKSKSKNKKEITTNQSEWEREIKNLKRRISYATHTKGLYFEELPIPDKPKRITKQAIERLKEIRGEKLWSLSSPYSYDEWEEDDVLDYADYYETDNFEENVLKGVEERIANFSVYDFDSMFTGLWHEQNKDRIEGLLEMAIEDEGRTTVAYRMEIAGSTRMNELIDKILKDSDGSEVETSIQEFSEIIYSGAMHPISEYGY